MLLGLATAVAFAVQGASERINLEFTPENPDVFDPNSGEPTSFWGRFKLAYDEQAEQIFADRLHPLNVLGWRLKWPDETTSQFLDHSTRTAHRALATSIEYSLREASVGLPLMAWIESRQELFGGFVSDSVNAVEEEEVAPLDPAYHQAERSWWNDLAERRVMRYGIRPFQPEPYAFFSLGIRSGDRLLFMSHMRYYYRNFGDHRFELAVSLPLANGFAVDLGTAYQFGQHEMERKLVLKLFKPLKNGGIVHIGFEAQKNPFLFAGITVPL